MGSDGNDERARLNTRSERSCFRDEKSSQGFDRAEIQANQFAAELLMPERFVRALTNNSDVADAKADDAAVRQLKVWARRFGVSAQAMSLRIANLSTFKF